MAAQQGAWSTHGQDVERAFGSNVPSVPVTPAASYSPSPGSTGGGGYSPRVPDSPSFGGGNTLDEPVWDTIKRDLKRIYANLALVVFPFKNRDLQSAALRNWDLWGPMAFTLVLALCLSIGAPVPSKVFSLVFSVLSLGAIVLTVNVVLLGGNIGFFQAMCLLGYCIFPLDIAAFVSLFTSNSIARWVVTLIALGWASWASVPFIGGSVSPARRALAVYPLLLLYTTIAWLALIKG